MGNVSKVLLITTISSIIISQLELNNLYFDGIFFHTGLFSIVVLLSDDHPQRKRLFRTLLVIES